MFVHNRMVRSASSPSRRFSPTRRSSWIAAALAFLTLGAPVRAAGPTNVVYVESNDPSGNAILAYSRHADGSLIPLPGSPFPTGGLGVSYSTALGPYDSDQEIIINPAHTLLFAVNGGSDTIAVFHINPNGSLTPVAGSPFPSGGSNPVSVGLADDTLCVVNQDNDPGHPGMTLPNYTALRVHAGGQLSPIPKSTLEDDLGSSPSQALISPDGKLMFGADFLGGALRSFHVNDGKLKLADTQGLPAAIFEPTGSPPLPLGLAVHPTHPLLYVGFVTVNQIGVYQYNPHGTLSFLRTVPNTGHGVCWITLNTSATRMYASNTGDPSVSVYDISHNAALPVQIQKLDLRVISGSNPGGYQFKLDPTGKFLYVVTQQSTATSTGEANALHVLNVAPDGTLTEVASSPTILPVPNMVRPQGVAAL